MALVINSSKILPPEGVDRLVFDDFHACDWRGQFMCTGLQVLVIIRPEDSPSCLLPLSQLITLFNPHSEHTEEEQEEASRPKGSYLRFCIKELEMLVIPTYHIPFQSPTEFYDLSLPSPKSSSSLLRADTKDLLVEIIWPNGKIPYPEELKGRVKVRVGFKGLPCTEERE